MTAGEGGGRPPSLPGFAAKVAAEQLNQVLDADAIEWLGSGLLKLKAIRECADKGKHPADETIVVSLGATKLTSTNYPILDVSLDGSTLLELKFTLDLSAAFKTLEVHVRDARIVLLKPGTAAATATLKYGDLKLKEQSTPEWKLPGEVSFAEGIRIS
jgi:hypothetical protein